MTRLAERVDVRSDLWIAFVQPSKLGASMETEKEKRVNWDIPKCGAYTAYRSHDGTFLEIKASDLAMLKLYAQEAKARIEELEMIARLHEEDSIFLSYLRAGGVDNWDGYSDAIKACYVGDDE